MSRGQRKGDAFWRTEFCLHLDNLGMTGRAHFSDDPSEQVLIQIRFPQKLRQVASEGSCFDAKPGGLIMQRDGDMSFDFTIKGSARQWFVRCKDSPVGPVRSGVGYGVDFEHDRMADGSSSDRAALTTTDFRARQKPSTFLDLPGEIDGILEGASSGIIHGRSHLGPEPGGNLFRVCADLSVR